MKRAEIIKKLRKAAKAAGKDFTMYELTNHTGIQVGETRSTLARHTEINDMTARKFFDQYAVELGKGWWR